MHGGEQHMPTVQTVALGSLSSLGPGTQTGSVVLAAVFSLSVTDVHRG